MGVAEDFVAGRFAITQVVRHVITTKGRVYPSFVVRWILRLRVAQAEVVTVCT